MEEEEEEDRSVTAAARPDTSHVRVPRVVLLEEEISARSAEVEERLGKTSLVAV